MSSRLPQFRKATKPSTSSKKRATPRKPKLVKTVHAYTSIGKRIQMPKPKFTNITREGDAAVRIKHREYMRDVIAPSTVADFVPISTIAINPGNVDMCPWLSNMAMNYESYTIEKLEISYKSTCNTNLNGVLELLVDYDSYDAFPLNKSAFMNSHRAARCNVWDSITLKCDKADLQKIKKRYCLDVPPPDGRDVRLYNVGNLFVALSGAGVNFDFGELYCDYEIVLQTPNMNQPPTYVDITLNGDSAAAFPWRSVAGVLATITGAAGLIKLVNDQWNELTFQKVGKYLVEQWWQTDAAHTPSDATSTIVSVDGNATITSPYGQASYSHSISNATLTNNSTRVIEVKKVPAVVSFDTTPCGSAGFNLTGGTVVSSRCHVTEL